MPLSPEQLRAAARITVADGGDALESIGLVKGRLSINSRGEVKSLFINVIRCLEGDPDLADRLRMNDLYMCPEWRNGDGVWVAVSDAAEGEIIALVERRYDFAASGHIHRALLTVASRNMHNPVSEYLRSLEWDGVERISDFLEVYLGAAGHDPLRRRKSRCLLIWCVARAVDPGCQVDTMLILQGRQGMRKSTGLKALFSSEFYKDSELPLGHAQDKYQALSGVWGYEIAEMAAFSKRDWNAIKAFITSTQDRFRPSYGRNMIDRHRRCIFVGTTNQQEFLRDPTGARRFPVVEVVRRIDRDAIQEDRDQLWAEAVIAFDRGEAWHFTDAENEALQEQNIKYLRGDLWEDAAEEWLFRRHSPFSLAEILDDGVGIKLEHQGAQERARIVSILESFGCSKVRHPGTGKDQKSRCGYTKSQTGLRGNPVRKWNPPIQPSPASRR